MPLPTIPGTVRASVAGDIVGGGRWSNTLHFRRTDLAEPSLAQIDELHGDLEAIYTSHFIFLCLSGTTVDSWDYTPLDGVSGAIHKGTLVAGGTTTGDPLPPEVAVCLTLRTPLRGRRARGRIFLPATAEATSDGGRLGPSSVSFLLAGAASLLASTAADGWELGVASYGRSVKVNFTTTPKTYAVTTWSPYFTAVNSFTLDNAFDVIRSRKS